MTYSETPADPGDPLTCWWQQHVDTEVEQLVVPDGHADVLAFQDGSVVLVGPTASFEKVVLPPGTRVRGARIAVGRLRALMGCSGDELRGTTLPVSAVLGDRRSRIWAETLTARSRLPAAIAERERDRDRRLESTLRAMTHDPLLTPDAVSHLTGLSARHLRRLFHLHVGLGTRTWSRVARLQRTMHLLQCQPAMPLADVASVAGYSDHAHLTRELQALTGMPPSRARRWLSPAGTA